MPLSIVNIILTIAVLLLPFFLSAFTQGLAWKQVVLKIVSGQLIGTVVYVVALVATGWFANAGVRQLSGIFLGEVVVTGVALYLRKKSGR